jgi:oligosaccharide reducing-end xylanase
VRKLCVASALFALASCTSTVDSVGYNGPGGVSLRRLDKTRAYPNPFKEIGKTDKEIADKIAATWNQLFYGDPGLEAIYVPMGADQAYIQDTLHIDQRTEGIGLAMMIAVELDKRAEFDRLWTWANEVRKQKEGPHRGYFESRCDTATMSMTTMPCDDPYGHAQMVTALIFAHDRWTSTTTLDYETGALDLLTVMRHKQDENNGKPVEGVTDTFDQDEALPFDQPVVAPVVATRPSIIMPAYYDLWAEATGDPFWMRAAQAGRDYWKLVAHPDTGLTPVKADFDGKPIRMWEDFSSEAYRAQINMALDWAWTKGDKDPWQVEEANRLLGFFAPQGLNTYGRSYKLDGTLLDGTHDLALVAANGVSAMVASTGAKAAFLNAIFDLDTPTGPARYYAGILDLTALLILSGQYRIW